MKVIACCFAILTWISILCLSASAQFNSPTVDGIISTAEYGAHTNGQNQQTTGTGQTWYVTWDNTNLYIAATSANLAEGAVIYIDQDPINPPNSGTNDNGNLIGTPYDSTNFASLPFRADFVAYFKNTSREYRRADGSGGWSATVSGFGRYASGPGSVREVAIPWASITGGAKPPAFSFFAYLTSPGGYVYGQVPQGNAGTVIGTNAAYSRYYAVTNTNNGTSTPPFSRDLVSGSASINLNALYHDTFDQYYRSPFGALMAGMNVTLRLRTERADVTGAFLKVYRYDSATNTTAPAVEYPMQFLETRDENGTPFDVYSIDYQAPAVPSILYYKFRVADGAASGFYCDNYSDDNDNLGQGGSGVASPTEAFQSFQLTVYKSDFTTPTWLQNASVYHIFPDRFRNGDITNDWCRSGNTTGCPSLYGGASSSNIIQTIWNTQMVDPRATGNNSAYGSQFYGGDLKGIEDKLDYIKSLGFDTIYLNPIFKARSNHRYDTDDFLGIATELGGDAAFQSLSAATNTRGMHIILDGVFNHMSQDSEYFDYYHRSSVVGACESLSSTYRSWFNFSTSRIPCTFTDYEGWFGFSGLPAFNETAAVKDFFYRTPTTNVTQYWYDRGASGWRFDVAPDISHQWWNEYRGFAKSYKADGPLIGEIFPDASQYLVGDQLDGSMNYRFRKNVLGFARGIDWEDNDNNGGNKITGLDPSQVDRAMTSIREDYPLSAQRVMLNLLDSHDTNRALYTLTVPGDTGLTQAKQRLKIAAIFQFTYIGAPMVYYGDEAGINAPSQGANGGGLSEDDPYNRAPYPWADEAGNPNIYGPADADLIGFYTSLGTIRKQHPALRTGTFKTILTGDTTASTTDNNTFAFVRADGNDKVIVAMNNGLTANSIRLPLSNIVSDGSVLTNLLDSSTYVVSGGNINLSLAAREGAILLQRSEPAIISGRVLTSDGRGVRNATVSISDSLNNRRTTTTSSFGLFSFGNVLAGDTYTLQVSSRRYRYAPVTVQVTNNLTLPDFVGLE